MGSIPGLGRSPGGGHGNPLQYSCLEKPMDRGAWWATVCGVAKSWTRLKGLSMHTRGQDSVLSLLRAQGSTPCWGTKIPQAARQGQALQVESRYRLLQIGSNCKKDCICMPLKSSGVPTGLHTTFRAGPIYSSALGALFTHIMTRIPLLLLLKLCSAQPAQLCMELCLSDTDPILPTLLI